jgi:iron complex outermembrane receptor protein
VEVELGVENLFDVTYTNHLNAKNPFTGTPVPEPGRVVTTTLTVHF